MSGLRVAVVGASGFTGKECLRLLAGHPEVSSTVAMASRAERQSSNPSSYPGALREPAQESFALDRLFGLDAVMLCTPHETSASLAADLVEKVGCVIDLSAAFRLQRLAAYDQHYGFTHPHPELCASAVFGLTEWARERLPGAKLVANPGCYVTSVLLPVKALLAQGCLAADSDIIADCKSGVSGAGKAASAVTHFASVHEDFRAYAVGTHRHEPEIREQAGTERLFFTPHLLPVFRGILSTIHVRPAPGRTAADLQRALHDRYRGEPFVIVHGEADGLPCLADVQGSNRCHIGVAGHDDRAVVVSCLDNLIKGASGQAIQNLNAVLGLPETLGLETPRPLAGWR